MNRMRVIAAILVPLILAGCTAPVVMPPAAPQLGIVEEDQGWVQVRVLGVPTTGYKILWGDAATSYGTTDVAPWEELYEHFYQAVLGGASGEQVPTEYEIVLINEKGHVVAKESILIASVVCHLELVRLEGREVTVQYWGRFGIDYSISWGDKFADHLTVSTQSASDTATHTYSAPGTYALGMEEIWAPRRI
ncbi:hypothetical protein ACFLR0_01835, partial [Candidatus Bipolaricaulota bacterium]